MAFDFNAPSSNKNSTQTQDQELEQAWQRLETIQTGTADKANLVTAMDGGGFADINTMATARGWSLPDTSKLNASNLNSSQPIQYSTPEQTPVYPVAGLNSDGSLTQTEPEQKASALSQRLQELNNTLIGKSSYTAEQEAKAGLPELQKTQTDLSSQLKAIQNEALSIPLQMQQEATGKGITAGGLQPLQTARLRTNAIQALSVNSLLEASKGNISTALAMVDRAVAQKFDPIKEEIDAKTKNLELILKSPEYTIAEKNRAQAQLDYQNSKKAEATKAEEEQKSIMTTATEAAKNGADAMTLKMISEAKTQAEALQIAAPFMAAKFNNEQAQQEFENSLKAGSFNMQKQELENKIKQQSFDNGVTLQNLQLDRAKFASDQEYKNAQLVLDQMKLSAPSKKDIVKINGVDYQLNADGTYTKPDVPEEVQQATQLQQEAGDAAQSLLDKLDMANLGTGRLKGTQKIPGTDAYAFDVDFNNLISKLQLDAVKYLKGQGQITENERKILREAVTSLDTGLDAKTFKSKLQDITVTLGAPRGLQEKSDGTYIYKNLDGTVRKGKLGDNYIDKTKPPAPNFSRVDGDTNSAITSKLAQIDNGASGGQCGRFVNKLTGLGVGDSYKSKMAKMDSSIKQPEPGMVFTMPYRDTGHVGFIVGIDGNNAIVKDSNYGLNEEVKTHIIPISKMTGFARV